MSQKESTFSIGELSKEFGVTTRSIRFYEDKGLLSPTRQGLSRIYHIKDKVRLKLILRGKRLGFSLAQTRTLFELYDTDKNSSSQLHTMLTLIDEKIAALNQQLSDIELMLLDLNSTREQCQQVLNKNSGETPPQQLPVVDHS